MIGDLAVQHAADGQNGNDRDHAEVLLHHDGAVALVGPGVELMVVAQLEVAHGCLVVLLHQLVLADAHIGGFQVGAQAQHLFKVRGGVIPFAVVVVLAGAQQGRAELGGLVDVHALQAAVGDDQLVAQPGDARGQAELAGNVAHGAENGQQLAIEVVEEHAAVGLVQHRVYAVGLDRDVGEGAGLVGAQVADDGGVAHLAQHVGAGEVETEDALGGRALAGHGHDEAFAVQGHIGEGRCVDLLRVCLLLVGVKGAPEDVQQVDGGLVHAEVAGEGAILVQFDDALLAGLHHAVDAVRVVHGDLGGRELRRAGHVRGDADEPLEQQRLAVQHDDALVAGVRQVQFILLGVVEHAFAALERGGDHGACGLLVHQVALGIDVGVLGAALGGVIGVAVGHLEVVDGVDILDLSARSIGDGGQGAVSVEDVHEGLFRVAVHDEDAAVGGGAHVGNGAEGAARAQGIRVDHLREGEGCRRGLDVAEEVEGVAVVDVAGAVCSEGYAAGKDQEGCQHDCNDSLHHLCASLILHARGGHGLDDVGLGNDEHRHRHGHHDEGNCGRHARTRDTAGNQLGKHVGQGLKLLGVDEHAAGGAPHLLEGEDDQGDPRRLTQGHDDLPVDGELLRAVDGSGLQQGIRDLADEVLHQVQAQGAADGGQDDGPVGVNQPQVGHDEVVGDGGHGAGEHQRVHDQLAHHAAAGEFVLRQGEGSQGAQHHRAEGAQARDDDGVEDVAGQRNVEALQDEGEVEEVVHRGVVNGQLGRENEDLAHGLEGVDDRVDQREQGEQAEGAQENHQCDIHAQRAAGAQLAAAQPGAQAGLLRRLGVKILLFLSHFLFTSLTDFAQDLLHQDVAEQHEQEQEHRDGTGIAHLVAQIAVVMQVGHDGMTCVVDGGEAHQVQGDLADGEGAGDLHDRAEHQLGLHGRQGDVPQLLPAVLDAFHRACLVHRAVNGLQACDEGQEGHAQAHPQLHHDQDGHDECLGGEVVDGLLQDAQLHQPGVGVAVGVRGEDQLPHQVHVAGDGGRVEHQRHDGAGDARQLVDQPGKDEAHDVGQRTGQNGEHQGVLDGGEEHIVLNDEGDVVAQAGEVRCAGHVEGCEAEVDGGRNRQHREQDEHDGEGGHHEVLVAILLHRCAQRQLFGCCHACLPPLLFGRAGGLICFRGGKRGGQLELLALLHELLVDLADVEVERLARVGQVSHNVLKGVGDHAGVHVVAGNGGHAGQMLVLAQQLGLLGIGPGQTADDLGVSGGIAGCSAHDGFQRGGVGDLLVRFVPPLDELPGSLLIVAALHHHGLHGIADVGVVDGAIVLQRAGQGREAPQALDFRREDLQRAVGGVVRHAHGHFARAEAVVEVRLHLQAVDGEQIRVPLEGFHGLVGVERGGHAVGGAFALLAAVDLALVLVHHGHEDVQARGHAGGGHVELVVLAVEDGDDLHHVLPGVGHLSDAQLLHHVLAVEEHLEADLLGDAEHAAVVGCGADHAVGVAGRILFEAVHEGFVVRHLAQVNRGSAHGEVLGGGLVQADDHVRAVACQGGAQHHVHGDQLQADGYILVIGGVALVDHVLDDLGLLAACGGHPHGDFLGLAFTVVIGNDGAGGGEEGGEEALGLSHNALEPAFAGLGQGGGVSREDRRVQLKGHGGHVVDPGAQGGDVVLQLAELLDDVVRVVGEAGSLDGHLLQHSGAFALFAGDLDHLLHQAGQPLAFGLHRLHKGGDLLGNLVVDVLAGHLAGDLDGGQVQGVEGAQGFLHLGHNAADGAQHALQRDGVGFAGVQRDVVGRAVLIRQGVVLHHAGIAKANDLGLSKGNLAVDQQAAVGGHAAGGLAALEGEHIQAILGHLDLPGDGIAGQGPAAGADGGIQDVPGMEGGQRRIGVVLLHRHGGGGLEHVRGGVGDLQRGVQILAVRILRIGEGAALGLTDDDLAHVGLFRPLSLDGSIIGNLGRSHEGQGRDGHGLLHGSKGEGMLALGQVKHQGRAAAAVVILHEHGLLAQQLAGIGADLVAVLQADILIAPQTLEHDLGQGVVRRLAVDEHLALDVGGGAGQGDVADLQVVEAGLLHGEVPADGAAVGGVEGGGGEDLVRHVHGVQINILREDAGHCAVRCGAGSNVHRNDGAGQRAVVAVLSQVGLVGGLQVAGGGGLEGQRGDVHRALKVLKGERVGTFAEVEDGQLVGAAGIGGDEGRAGSIVVALLGQDAPVAPGVADGDGIQAVVGQLAIQQDAAADIAGGVLGHAVSQLQVIEAGMVRIHIEGPGDGLHVAVFHAHRGGLQGGEVQHVQGDLLGGQATVVLVGLQVGVEGGLQGVDGVRRGERVELLGAAGGEKDDQQGDSGRYRQADQQLFFLGHGSIHPFCIVGARVTGGQETGGYPRATDDLRGAAPRQTIACPGRKRRALIRHLPSQRPQG